MENEKKLFVAQGYVLGNLWGGGLGAYPTITISGESEEIVLEQAEKELKTGGLDRGMGFESLTGALLNIERIINIEIDGMPFTNRTTTQKTIGNLDEMDIEFLKDLIP
jgi:hypothetical protein